MLNKSHEVGLVLFGTEETENELNNDDNECYKFVSVVRNSLHCDLDFLRIVNDIRTTNQSGDPLDAIIVSMDMLFKKCGKKKYAKRIFLI